MFIIKVGLSRTEQTAAWSSSLPSCPSSPSLCSLSVTKINKQSQLHHLLITTLYECAIMTHSCCLSAGVSVLAPLPCVHKSGEGRGGGRGAEPRTYDLPTSSCLLRAVQSPMLTGAVSLEGYPVLLRAPPPFEKSNIGQKGRPNFPVSLVLAVNDSVRRTNGLGCLD